MPTFSATGGAIIPSSTSVYDPTAGKTSTPAAAPTPAPTVPTTLASSNIQDKVIPDLTSRLKNLESGGTYMGQDGNVYYNADSSAVSAPLGAEYNGQTWNSGGQSYKDGPTYAEDPQQNALLQGMKQNLDAQTLAQVKAIEQQSEVLKAQQADVNKRYEAGTEQALLLGGSARYAPVSSGGTMAAAQTYGLQQIAALDAQEKDLIAKARSAQSAGNFQLMQKSLDLAEKTRAEKQAEATKLSDAKAAEIQKVRDQNIKSSRDSAVADLVGQGISDPTKLLDLLNFDDKGNQTGDFTAQEIGDTLKQLTVNGTSSADFKTDLGTFQYLQKNGMLPAGITGLDPSQQYFAYLNMQKLANNGKLSVAAQTYGGGEAPASSVVGAGAKNATEEQIIRTRLFAKLSTILNKGTLSDTDRSIIDSRIAEFRNAGMSEQQIMSQLAGFPADVQTPYNSSFIDLVAGNTDTNEKQQTLMAKVGQLLASGNNVGAMKTVESTAMDAARKQDPDNYMGTGTVETYTKKIDHVKQLIDKYWPATVGPVSGSMQQIFGKLKSNQAQEIQSVVADLTAQFRKDISGSAVTETEAKFLEPLIASLSDRKSNFTEKLDALQSRFVTQYNSTRSLSNLPEVNVQQILDPQSRLELYATDMQKNKQDDPLGLLGEGASSSDNPLGI